MADADILLSSISGTAKQSGHGHFFKELIMISWIPIAIMGFIGNGMVSYLFWHRHNSSRFLLYFQNIAIANFTILFNVVVYFQKVYLQIRLNNLFEHLIQMVQLLGRNTRFYILTAICAEKYLLIFSPAWVKHYRPQYTSVLLACIFWGLSCLTSVVDNLTCYPAYFITRQEYETYCVSFTIVIIILELVVFLFIMVFSTLAILSRIEIQARPPPRLDITIVATVFLYLLTDTPTRITHHVATWFYEMDMFLLVLMTQLLDSINCAVNPFIFLIVGCWKTSAEEPVNLCLERALALEENMAEGTQMEQQQA